MNTIQRPKSFEVIAPASEEDEVPTKQPCRWTGTTENGAKMLLAEKFACEEISHLLRPTNHTSILIHKLCRGKEEVGRTTRGKIGPG